MNSMSGGAPIRFDGDQVAWECHEYARLRGWHQTTWEQFYYLGAEATELSEALRGKGRDAPRDEAVDVLFVLFAILHRHGLSASAALVDLRSRMQVELRILREMTCPSCGSHAAVVPGDCRKCRACGRSWGTGVSVADEATP